MLHSIWQQIWKTQQWPQDCKRSVFIPIPKKGSAKESSNYCSISHASKVRLNILQARLQQYMNREIPDVQAGFRKGRGTRDQIANIHWIIVLWSLVPLPLGFPGSTSGKEPACQCRRYKRCGFEPWVRKIPWRRAWQPIPVFLPGESLGQRSLVGYST